jgi:hypothetical protein
VTTIVDAIIVRGAGAATKNMRNQLPQLVRQFPDIENVHPDSINVKLVKPLPRLKYDFITSPIRWFDVGPNSWQTETFGFLEIKFEYPVGNSAPYRAWLFDCYNSACHNDPPRYEIISKKIDGIAYNQPCRVHLP